MFETILIILEQALIHVPLVLGAYVSLSLLKIPDLSLESAYVFGALCSAQMVVLCKDLSFVYAFPLIICAALFGGALVGLASSLITQKAGLPHLLSSIITFGIFHGINQLIAPSYVSLTQHTNHLAIFAIMPKHPEIIMIGLISLSATIFFYFFFKTQLGYACAIYGTNNQFFSHYGISTSFVFTAGVLIANAFAGLGGFLFAQTNGFAEYTMGLGKILLCITALILGKVIIKPQQPLSMLMPLGGCFFYFALQQGLLKVGFDAKYFTMIQALTVLVLLVFGHKKNLKKSDHLGV